MDPGPASAFPSFPPVAPAFTPLTEDAQTSIRKKGVCYVEDVLVGRSITEFGKNGFPTRTKYGLEFVAQNALDRQDIQTVIKSILGQCIWGYFRIFSDKVLSESAAFLNNPSFFSTPRGILVQLWSPGSLAVFYEGSHVQKLKPKDSKSGLLLLPRMQMTGEGIVERKVQLNEGGLAIMDSRLGFSVLKGHAIVLGFWGEDEIHHWGPMDIQDSEELRAKVDQLGQRGIRINLQFVETQTKEDQRGLLRPRNS